MNKQTKKQKRVEITKTRPLIDCSSYPRAKARGFTGSHKWGRVFGIENLAVALNGRVLHPTKISNARFSIEKGIELIDHALWIPEQKLLAISDTHIGYEEALNKKGILVPRFGFDEMCRRMKKIIDAVKKESDIQTILINGDLKHEFGTISYQEWRETLQFLDLLLAHAPDIVIVKGNHDTIIGPIARKREVKLVDYFIAGEVLFIHGNVIPDDFAKIMEQYHTKTIVIGNEHPAITIGTRLRREKYKCFLKGKYKRKTLIVLPSFNTLAEGTDVTQGRILSPFIQKSGECEVWVIDEQNNTHRCFGMARTASSTQSAQNL